MLTLQLGCDIVFVVTDNITTKKRRYHNEKSHRIFKRKPCTGSGYRRTGWEGEMPSIPVHRRNG